ncbi:MAG TPA: helix-turn-helix domain-containing protein [Hyphomonadaceae bacterium]|nr:helix-turn-helix domain-containing protein [Hyphomonadaceae bacterium]
MRKKAKGRIGSSLDSFLKEEGRFEATQAVAIKRVLAWQIEHEMKAQAITKKAMAERMQTSRAQLDRLLDPSNESVTLDTLTRAAHALGRNLRLELQ